jgi:uncharacterized membrane protein YfcA
MSNKVVLFLDVACYSSSRAEAAELRAGLPLAAGYMIGGAFGVSWVHIHIPHAI